MERSAQRLLAISVGMEGLQARHSCLSAVEGAHAQQITPDPLAQSKGTAGTPSLCSCPPHVILSHKARASEDQDNMSSHFLGLG